MTDTKVVSLSGDPVQAGDEAEPSVLAAIEEALDRARRGEITGIAIAEVHCNGATLNAWAGGHPISVLGEVTRLAWRMAQANTEH